MVKHYPIRVRATALIIEDGRVLLVQWMENDVIGYNLPGGGVQDYEGLRDAVKREIREETNAEAEVGPLAFVYEYEPDRDNKGYTPIHSLVLVFKCTLLTRPTPPETGDDLQIGLEWVPLDKLTEINLIPEIGAIINDYARTGQAQPLFIEDQDLYRG